MCVQMLRSPPKLVPAARDAQAAWRLLISAHQAAAVVESCTDRAAAEHRAFSSWGSAVDGVIQASESRALLDREGQYPRGGPRGRWNLGSFMDDGRVLSLCSNPSPSLQAQPWEALPSQV